MSSAGACCRSCGDEESSALRVKAPRYDGEIVPGQDLAELLLALVSGLEDGDIIAVSSKAVAKAEGRVVEVGEPWARERLIEQETVREVAWRDTPSGRVSVVENRLGVVGAAAGVDMSNVASGFAVLLPIDPDSSRPTASDRAEYGCRRHRYAGEALACRPDRRGHRLCGDASAARSVRDGGPVRQYPQGHCSRCRG